MSRPVCPVTARTAAKAPAVVPPAEAALAADTADAVDAVGAPRLQSAVITDLEQLVADLGGADALEN
ncbi:hypothetical protein ACFWAR_34325 [Streptomyces sp. NPDC059917]|uniref:hypothetical protein n=1 Tax=Streptomyces sp. NPDC059917 TaxID=3347002 RepID=UPI003646AF58